MNTIKYTQSLLDIMNKNISLVLVVDKSSYATGSIIVARGHKLCIILPPLLCLINFNSIDYYFIRCRRYTHKFYTTPRNYLHSHIKTVCKFVYT